MSKHLNTNFTINAPKPIDSRMQVSTYAGLDAIPVKYDRMVTHVHDEDADYKYYANIPEWVEVTAASGGSATAWGDITGTIANQTDLINLLTSYSLTTHTHPQQAPLAHTHVEVDITDLDKYTQAEVDALIDYKEGYSTGLVSGGVVSIAGAATFNVSQGVFIFLEMLGLDPFEAPIAHEVTATEFLAEALPLIATHPATYIGYNYILGAQSISLIHSSTPFSSASTRAIIPLAVIHHPDNATISFIEQSTTPTMRTTNQLHDLMVAFGVVNLGGNVYGPNGANLTIDKTTGVIFKRGVAFTATPDDPHKLTILQQLALTFNYRTQDSVEAADATTLDPDSWDDGGTVSAVPTDKFTVQRIYLFASGKCRIQYGQTLYDSKEDAIAQLGADDFTTDPVLQENATLRAYVAIKEGSTDASIIEDVEFFTVSRYGSIIQPLQNIVSDKHYTHVQSVSSDTWVIPHGLAKQPSISIEDDAGNTVRGDISRTDLNNLTVSFNFAFTGVAYLN
jgi:hypothetical protein